MNRRHFAGLVASLALGCFGLLPLSAAKAAEYPSRPVEFIVPWKPGGGSDVLMRITAHAMEKYLKQPVPVINMPGASGTTGLKAAEKRKPDGYTIAQIHDGLLVAHHTGLTPINWDTFIPVAQITSSPQYLVVRKDAPYKTLAEMIAFAKKNPGKIKVGVTIAGVPHLQAAMVEEATGVEFSYVGFEGTGERIRGVLGGTVDMAVGDVASAGQFVKNGDMRFLAVGAAERQPQAPDVPTFKELGYDLDISVNRGIAVPKGTPKAVIATLEEAVRKVSQDPEARKQLNNSGAAVVYRDSAQFSAYLSKLDATVLRLIGKLNP